LDLIDATEIAATHFTSDGIHLTSYGQGAFAKVFAQKIGLEEIVQKAGALQSDGVWANPVFEQLRQQVISKNRLWFNYWRPQNWAFLGGDRTEQPSSRDHRDPKIRWFPEEMKRYTSLISDAETKIEEAANATR
jgi:hypothetical protein